VRRPEIEAVGELAGEVLAAGGTLVKEMHEGIAGRPFGVLGPAAMPVRLIHDGISDAVYDGVRVMLRAASRSGARALAARAGAEAPALASGLGGSIALGVLNGLYGNYLPARGSDLALVMSIRRDDADVPAAPAAPAAAFPDATSRIVLFVHGLCETDEAWRVLP
jgi:hypothetical protein